MARFSEEWLARLLEKSDIVDVINEYVPLKRKGTNLWANCPWHAEKNPSFSVSPSKQMFYCFSCKRGGGVINFIMEHEKLSYLEAVTLLADRVGMEMPEAQEDTGYQQRKEYRKRLYTLMRDLALHYHHNLKSPDGKAGLEYIKKRKIAGQIGPYGLGFALDSYDDAYQYLLGKGYTLKEMLDAGVVRQKEGRVYDFFRNRAMFPIQSHFGDVIAFGGRVMDDSNPKYLNSGETYFQQAVPPLCAQPGKKAAKFKPYYPDGRIYGCCGAGGHWRAQCGGFFRHGIYQGTSQAFKEVCEHGLSLLRWR